MQFSFNSQTQVPRLISRLREWEKVTQCWMKRKETEGKKSPLPLIRYGNISCLHIHCGYENQQLGDGRDGGKQSKERERCTGFSERQEMEESARVGRRRRHRGRGDERRMKREGDMGENLPHLAHLLIPNGWDVEWDVGRAFGSKRGMKSAFDMRNVLGGADRRAGRQATTKTDGQKGKSSMDNKRQLVTVAVTSDRAEAKQHGRHKSRRPTEQTCMHILLWHALCVLCAFYVSRESPAPLLELFNNPQTGSSALDLQMHRWEL